MDIEIGRIKSISGTVTATNTQQDTVRNLLINESIYANELITTYPESLITIEFPDGNVIELGSNTQLTVDSSVFDPVTNTSATINSIQQAILAGLDPTQSAEATAAGAGTQVEGNEGHPPVFINYLAPQVIPTSGFDTTGISIAFPETLEEIQPVLDDSAPSVENVDPPVEPPVISIIINADGGSAIEGDNVTFTVSQNLVSSEDTTLTVEILSLPSDSATEGQDYQLIDTITLVIPAGSNIAQFNVESYIDSLQEGNETFSARIVSASNPSGIVNISTALATGIILDDYDSPIGADTIHLTADEALIVDTVSDNTLTFTAGTSDLTHFKFDTNLASLKLDTNEDGLADVSWQRISDTEIEGKIGSSVAVTLTLTASTIASGETADVAVQAVLDDAFKHLAIPGRNPLDLGSITVIASSANGDAAVGTAYLAIIDDIIEITSLTNASLVNSVGAEATGDLVIDAGEDGLASLTFSGTVPLGLKTSDGHEISYQSQADGSLHAIDENSDLVFSLTQNDTGDGYTLTLDQLLQGPVVETTVSLTGTAVDAAAPTESATQVYQEGIIVNLSATDDTGSSLINASSDGYGVNNDIVNESNSEIVTISLADPNGTFNEMSVTVGNFSTTGNSTDIYSYQLYLDGAEVGNVQTVPASATNSSTNTTIAINGQNFDEIRMWAMHSGDSTQAEGSYKIISVDTDVTATSYEDVVLNFGVDAVDADGDIHGGDFQVAVDINSDASYLFLDDPSLDSLIDNPVDEVM